MLVPWYKCYVVCSITPYPVTRVIIKGYPKNKELIGKTGTLVKYTDCVVEVDGAEHYLSTNSIRLED
jgi:hypothetical protein